MMRIPILMYHYISSPPPGADAVRQDLSVPPDVFRSEMAFIAGNGFHTIHLADLAQSFKKGEKLPGKPIIITFDDGYDDNYTNAFPALKEFGFTGTFFIIAGRADGNAAGYMTWQQIQELEATGMEIGNHSVDHAYNLGQVSRAVQWAEIKPAFDDLAWHLPGQVPVFAYPSGSYNATTVGLLEQLGYIAAVTTLQSTWQYEARTLELRRIRVHGPWSLAEFINAMQYWTQGMY